MKQTKTLTRYLLALVSLVLMGTGMTAAETISCSANLSSVNSSNRSSGSADGTNCTITWSKINSASIELDGTTYWKFDAATYTQLTLTSGSFQAGDKLTVELVNQNASEKTIGFCLKSADGNGTSAKTASMKSTTMNYILQEDDIEDDGTIKIFRGGSNASDARYYSFSVTGTRSTGGEGEGGNEPGEEDEYIEGTATYAIKKDETHTAGESVDVKDEGNDIVATLTFGFPGGADYKEGTANDALKDKGFSAYTEGNGENGKPDSGTNYIIKPKYDGTIGVGTVLNADKAFYILEDGIALSDYNGITVSKKETGGYYTFNVKAGSEYKVYASGTKLGFYGFNYDFKKPAPKETDPALIVDLTDVSFKVLKNGETATQEISIEGTNLEGTELTATLASAVEGLSVALTSKDITDGTISTTATLTYEPTENAKGTTTLKISDGTTTKEVTITYIAKVEYSDLETISEETTWDFKNVSGGVEFKDDNLTTEYVYADIADFENLTFTDKFNSKALAFKGQYPLRAGKTYAQNGTLHFKTSVQGTIVVKFSDTGSSFSKDNDGNVLPAAKRYLNINGVNTEYYTQRDGDKSSDEKTVTVFVSSGDVYLCGKGEDGETDQAICVYSIAFTPVTETTLKIVNGSCYRTFASKYPTDWSNVQGITAYTAKVSGNEIEFKEVDGVVPAGAGLLLKAEVANPEKEYSIPTATEPTPEDYENVFVGVTAKTEVEGQILILHDGNRGVVGFYITSAEKFEVSPNSAYIPATIINGVNYIAIPGSGEDGTTGLNAIENAESNGTLYDLQGRKVSNPAKGLYISNGKKYIVK